jgi:hypothetical protein
MGARVILDSSQCGVRDNPLRWTPTGASVCRSPGGARPVHPDDVQIDALRGPARRDPLAIGDQLPKSAVLGPPSEMILIVLISPPSIGTSRSPSPVLPASVRIVVPSGDKRPCPNFRSLSARAPLPSMSTTISVVFRSSGGFWRVKTIWWPSVQRTCVLVRPRDATPYGRGECRAEASGRAVATARPALPVRARCASTPRWHRAPPGPRRTYPAYATCR